MEDCGKHAIPQKLGIWGAVRDIAFIVTATVILTWLMTSFVGRAYAIPSSSMEKTIMTGDCLFAEKISYLFRDPQPGDIITFQDPEIPGRTLIKRCVAIGGQEVDLLDGRLMVDGVVISEPYTRGLPSKPLKTAFDVSLEYPYVIPDGHLWVMGDNRTNSNDSRYFGAIDAQRVSGRAALVFWPFTELTLL